MVPWSENYLAIKNFGTGRVGVRHAHPQVSQYVNDARSLYLQSATLQSSIRKISLSAKVFLTV